MVSFVAGHGYGRPTVSSPAQPVVAPSARDLLRDRSVATYLLAATAQTIATTMQAAVLGKQIYDITDSTLALGLLGLVEFLPALLLLPLTGSAADRFDRRRVASIALGVEVVVSALYCVYASTDPTSAVPIFAIAAIFGTARAFAAPSFRSLPPLIAPDDGLPRMIALYSGTWQFGLIVGPAVSGFLYDIGPSVPYAVAGVFFAAAALIASTLRLRRVQERTSSEERPTLHHAMEGLRFIRGQPVLLGAIALDMFAVLFGGAVALLPAIAEDRLGVGNVGYGWLRAAPGVGAVIVTAVLALRPVRRHVGRTLLVAVLIFGLATIVLGLTRNYTVAFVALLILAGADAVSVFIRATIVPLATPDHMRGRVMAVENVFIGASNELGAFESGVVGTLIGVGPAVTLGGILTVGVVGTWWFLFPPLRDIDRFEDIAVDSSGGRSHPPTAGVPDPGLSAVVDSDGSSPGEASDNKVG
jgi:MFS family permease